MKHTGWRRVAAGGALAAVAAIALAQGSTADEMARSQRAEFERWGPLVKRIGFTADS